MEEAIITQISFFRDSCDFIPAVQGTLSDARRAVAEKGHGFQKGFNTELPYEPAALL